MSTHEKSYILQELHNYQAWVVAELLDPLQWARAETTAFPQMMDALAIGKYSGTCMQAMGSMHAHACGAAICLHCLAIETCSIRMSRDS